MCKNAALGHRRLPPWLPMLLILLVHPNFDSRAQQEDPAGAGTSISPTLVPTTAAPAQQPTTDLPQIFPQQQQQQLVLRACCGGNCEEFQRPEEMYGIMCCGDEPSNQFEEICCGNVPRRRRQPSSFIDRCCGNQTLAYDQTCCNGVVHNIPSAECCGRMAYPRNSFNTLCCEENLLTNVEPSLTCCGKNGYDGGKREICCGGQVHLKEMFDGCCAIYGKDPAEYQPFNTRTQQCCDRPIERFGSTKCCYLKGKQGHFYPSSYDASSQCCAFPFTTVTPRNSNGTCIGGG